MSRELIKHFNDILSNNKNNGKITNIKKREKTFDYAGQNVNWYITTHYSTENISLIRGEKNYKSCVDIKISDIQDDIFAVIDNFDSLFDIKEFIYSDISNMVDNNALLSKLVKDTTGYVKYYGSDNVQIQQVNDIFGEKKQQYVVSIWVGNLHISYYPEYKKIKLWRESYPEYIVENEKLTLPFFIKSILDYVDNIPKLMSNASENIFEKFQGFLSSLSDDDKIKFGLLLESKMSNIHLPYSHRLHSDEHKFYQKWKQFS